MSSPVDASWPSDLTGLVQIASDASRPREVRERAVAELRPFHVRLARQVLERRAVADLSLADDIVSHLEWRLWQSAYDPQQGSYPAWSRRVSANALVDALRRAGRAAPLVEEESVAAMQDLQADLERSLDWRARFSNPDLDRIRAWPNALQRIVVLCRSLLWHKVPPDEWREWLQARGLPPEVPPAGFLDLEEIQQNRLLAGVLQLSVSGLHQHWHRGRHLLRELSFVQELSS